MGVNPKIVGKPPQIMDLFIGFSIINYFHHPFWGSNPPIFWKHPGGFVGKTTMWFCGSCRGRFQVLDWVKFTFAFYQKKHVGLGGKKNMSIINLRCNP